MLSRGKTLVHLALKKQDQSQKNTEVGLLPETVTTAQNNEDLLLHNEVIYDVKLLINEIIEDVCLGERFVESENVIQDGEYTFTEDCILDNSIQSFNEDISYDIESLPPLFSESGSEYLPSDIESERSIEVMESETNEENTGRKKCGRKRKYNNQSRGERKKKCNHNEEYINANGEKIVPKQFLEDFQCTCKKKCTEKVDIQARKKLFTQFWSIGSYSGRCAMINMCVKVIPKKRCYAKFNDTKRNNTRLYFIDNKEICKTTFLKTLQINQRRIDIALKKQNEEKIEDLRGLNSGGRNKVADEKSQEIINHIKSFPKYISHYCRRDSESYYLHADLNLAKMYSLYKDYLDEGKTPVSLSIYKKIFYKEFNLRFQKPKKDTCLKCDKYQAQIKGLPDNQKAAIKEEHSKHLEKAESLRQQMKKDLKDAKENVEVETLSFDLQKTHPLPKLPTGIVYYKRQLNFHNLGIHVGSTGKGIFNVWMEHEAGRGTQEVGSCLKKYIMENIKEPVKHLILWSDSCGGQNRSIKLVMMMMYTLQNHPSLESVTLRFLLSGHSFLPNDSEFGDVERVLKMQQRLYTDSEYITVMKECRKKNKFQVNKMNREDMVSVAKLTDAITNRKVDSQKEKVSWLATHEITILKKDPMTLYLKRGVGHDYHEQVVDIGKRTKNRPIRSMKDMELEKLWPMGKLLSKEKIKDLKEILKLVPQDAKPFYSFLRRATPGEFQDDVEGFGAETVDFECEDIEEGTDEED